MSSAGQLFRFCQLDFPFPLGPADGRYLQRDAGGKEVAVVAIEALHAERRRRVRGRRPARAQAGTAEPEPVRITRATVIAAEAFAGSGDAEAWLRACRDDRDRASVEVRNALDCVNRAVSAHRIAAQDPYVRDLVRADVQRARLGFGTGDEVVDSRWRDALVIPPEAPERRRRRMLSPQEEMAGMLSGRRPAGRPGEELLLRARLDLDHGRITEAALVARAAADALAAEGLAGGDTQAVGALAAAALESPLSEEQEDELAELIATLERAVRRRRYAEER